MPSRKRAKGKARKAKQKDRDINTSNTTFICHHGCPQFKSVDDVCIKFVDQFQSELFQLFYEHTISEGSVNIMALYYETIDRMYKINRFKEVFEEEATRKELMPLLLCAGTTMLLKEDVNLSAMASAVALATVSCEHGFYEDDVLASKDRNVYRDLMQGVPAFDSIKFFTKRIPCNCLKDLYSRAKSQPKLIQCHHCKKHKERRSLFLCGRCKIAHYCSKECQRTDYLQHESLCKTLGSTLS